VFSYGVLTCVTLAATRDARADDSRLRPGLEGACFPCHRHAQLCIGFVRSEIRRARREATDAGLEDDHFLAGEALAALELLLY
jgi:hypothetical protein